MCTREYDLNVNPSSPLRPLATLEEVMNTTEFDDDQEEPPDLQNDNWEMLEEEQFCLQAEEREDVEEDSRQDENPLNDPRYDVL